MSYYSAEEMKKTLKDYPKFQKRLYCRGFLITNEKQNVNLEYPFYANWKEETIGYSFYMYTHKETYAYTYERNQVIYFIIGHAYDPYNMLVDENEILKKLASAREKSEADYWDAESNLTGVFCVGYVTENQIVYTTDCAGMQLVYHGLISDKLYITSHAKLVADLKGLKQPEYIKRLTTNKYWHYWGTWLPGDLSPFDELKRMVPNHFGSYEKKQNGIEVVRFYPTEKIVETKTQQEYENTIHELGRIMSNTMECIAKKWPEKKVSISVTGGRDSMTALSCANKVYDKLHYLADYKTNLNYKSSGWFFLCNLYKNGKTRKRCKRMNDSAFLNSRRTGIFKDMSNGTICIPKDLRDNNGLEKNDRVELIPMQEGIYIRKAYGEKKCQ